MRRAAVTIGVVGAMAFAFAAVGGVGGALGAKNGAHDRGRDCRIGSKHCTPTTTITKTRTTNLGPASTVTAFVTDTSTDRVTSTVDGGVRTVEQGRVTETTGTITVTTGTDTATVVERETVTDTTTRTGTATETSTEVVDRTDTVTSTVTEPEIVATVTSTQTDTVVITSTVRSFSFTTATQFTALSCNYIQSTLVSWTPPQGGLSCLATYVP